MTQRLISINLTSLLVLAFGLSTFLHEMAHALAAKLVWVTPTLFHTYVSFDNSSVEAADEITILASGPVFSLIQSVVFLILLRSRKKFDLFTWFYLWMGVIGAVVFLGYLMMGPFVPYGDTGKILSLLNAPATLSYSISAPALFAIVLFFRKLRPAFVKILTALQAATGFDKTKSFLAFFVLPLMAGTLVNTLISMPAPTVVSLAFPLLLPLTLVPTGIRIIKSDWRFDKDSTSDSVFSKQTYWPVILLVLIIVVSRILARGIPL